MKKSRLRLVYLLLITFLTWLPILIGVIYSFNASKLSSVWGGFSFKWYEKLFRDRSMRTAFVNSVVLAASSSLLAAAISLPAALAFRRPGLPFEKTTKSVLMLPIMVPDIILGMAFLAFFRLLRFPFGMLTLVIAHTSFSIPYIYRQVATRLAGMNTAVIDASRVLGAGPIRTFFEVTLPYLFPSVLSGAVLSFAMSFDDVIISVFVTGANVNTLPIKVYTQVKTGMTPEVNALCAVMLLVALTGVTVSGVIKRKMNRPRRETESGQL